MNIGEEKGKSVIDRDNREVWGEGLKRIEGIIKSRERKRINIGKNVEERSIGVWEWLKMEGNNVGFNCKNDL